MANLALAFDILARDRASKEFDRVGDSVKRTSGHLGTLGKIAGGFALGGVATAAAGLTKAFTTGFGEVKDYQAGLADLNNVLKTTGGVAGISSKGMEDLASQIQAYSGQTDDSIVKSEGLLATFTNIRNAAGKNNDIFTQATKLTADMAQKFGGDASESAVRLGKALNDPTKGIAALTKIGVSFTEGQKKQIKAMQDGGNIAGAQKLILAELNKEVGGSAKAYGDTLPGMIDKGKRAFEDFAQSVVTAVLPVVTKLAKLAQTYLGPALTTLGNGARQVFDILFKGDFTGGGPFAEDGKFTGIIFQVRDAFTSLVSFVRANVLPVLRSLGDFVIHTVFPAFEKVAGILAGALRSAFETIGKKIQENRPQLEQLGNVLKAIGTFIIRDVLPPLGKVAGFLVGALAFAIGKAIGFIGGIVSAFNTVKSAAGTVVSFVTGKFNGLVDFFRGLPKRMAGLFVGAFDGFKDAFRGAANFIINGLNKIHFHVPGVDTHIPGVGKIGDFNFGIPQIPRLAEGGIVKARPGGILAQIGEGKYDEAVIPLKPGVILPGQGTTVHMPVTVYGQNDVIEKSLRAQRDALMFHLAT